MKLQRTVGRSLALGLALTWLVYFCCQAGATPASKIKDLKQQAHELEKHGHWGKACSLYARVLEFDSNAPGMRDRYFHCLRRYLQECRHSDPTFLNEVLKLKVSQSERLYEFILTYLSEHALEQDRVAPKRLYMKGLEEFDQALASPTFISEHLKKTSKDKIAAFRKTLHDHWAKLQVTSLGQAVGLVRNLATAARQQIKLPTTTTIIEFTCGSCYAVDDYTMYLTPAELRGLCSTLKGEAVGIGLKLGIKGDKMVITDIAPDSPAKTEAKPPLSRFDQVLAINGKSTAKMPPEVATDLLGGESGTDVELQVLSAEHGTRTVTLQRRNIFMPSVRYELMSSQVGYLSVSSFQASTVQEVDAALLALNKLGIKALILDLRGNSGGIFNAAIDVSRRFLNNGVIVSTQSLDFNPATSGVKIKQETFQAQNGAVLTLPMVVLVDGKTASAAEILAGALKENDRARLVGVPTFGKGCIQELYSLSPGGGLVFPGGLRITTARFLSPSGIPYSGKGIQPHILVGPDVLGKTDPQLQQAFDEIQNYLEEVNKPEMKM